MDSVETDKIKQAVREAYGAHARRFMQETPRTSCDSRSCGPPEPIGEPSEVVEILPPDLAAILDQPDSVPVVAQLQAGEVVLDLGSGGGIDCLRAARIVGPEGRVIGLDMTPEAVRLARRRAKKVGATNVDFRYGEIEDIPLPDASVDVVISNCVINLSPDKESVFREVYRVLRPGGRIVVSDIVLDGELPEPIRQSLVAWAGCVAGALSEADNLSKIRAAGFAEEQVLSREHMKISGQPGWKLARQALADADLAPDALDHTVVNALIKARKPAPCSCDVES